MHSDDLNIGGFKEWLPLALEDEPEEFVDTLVAHFGDDPAGPKTIRAMSIGLTVLTRQLLDMNDDQTLTLAAWVLLPPGGERLDPQAVARLVAVRVPAEMTTGELVADLVDGMPLHQPLHVETISTASGPAELVRARTYTTTEHGVDLHESVCVLWRPADENYVLALASLPIDDLVVASDASHAMSALAETISGIPQ